VAPGAAIGYRRRNLHAKAATMGRACTAADDLHYFAALDISQQAGALALMAHEARGVHVAHNDGLPAQDEAVRAFEQAVELAMDAEVPAEAAAARRAIESSLTQLVAAGMRVTPSITELDVDGVLGAMTMPILTAVLGPAPAAAG